MNMGKLRWFFVLLFWSAFNTVAAAPPVPALSYTQMKVQIARIQIQEGVSFDDAIESLKLRANQHNLKLVGASPLYKEIEALTGKPSRRMEIFSFCDGLVADQMIGHDPLMISFMPCRISLVEDAKGKRWVISMMLEQAAIRALPADIRKNVDRIMNAMKDMMIAAANGDI